MPDHDAADSSLGRTSESERARILANPGFGRHFSDHMGVAQWTESEGWSDPQIHLRSSTDSPDAAFDLRTSALHYSQTVFEGLKAFRQPSGQVALFRPEANAARLATSAERMALPVPPAALTMELIQSTVAADASWVPESDSGFSLYVRPVLVATSTSFGVTPTHSATLGVICTPAGSYFSGESQACSLWVERQMVRAAHGGVGEAKCGANYAAAMAAQRTALELGCEQTLFLDPSEHRFVEESGSMNILVAYADGRIETPALTGTILPGITRDSILTAASTWGLSIVETRIDINQLLEDIDTGQVVEVFACGTAAVITSVGALRDESTVHTVGDGTPGLIATGLRDRLTAIQFGRAADAFQWLHPVAGT